MRGGLVGGQPVPERGGSGGGRAMRTLAARAVARPDALLLVIAAVIFTYVWRFQDVLPAVRPLRPTLLLGLGVVVAFARVSPAIVGRRLRSPVLILLALLVAVVAVGQPFALEPPSVTRFLATWLLPGVLLAALVGVSARSTDDIEWLLLATLGAAALYISVMYARGGLDAVTDESVTVFYDRNELSLMLVVLLPAALHLARQGQPAARRAFAVACFLLFVFTIVRGGSRGGLVGLVVVLSYLLFTYRGLSRSARLWIGVAAALLLAAGGSAYWQRMRTILNPTSDYNWGNTYGWGATYGRAALWQRGLQYIRERPLVGMGGNSFPIAERDVAMPARQRLATGRRPIETLNAHNIFIQVAAELGLPGLAVFVALLIQMARMLVRLLRRHAMDPQVAAVAHVLLASLVGYVVCGFFLSAAYFPFQYVLIGLVTALWAVAGPDPIVARWRSRAGPPAAPAVRGGGLPPYEVPAPARW